MEIKYSVETEDLVAAAVASFENSKEAHKNRRNEQVSLAVSTFLFFVILYIFTNQLMYFVLGVVIGLLILFIWPNLQVRSLQRKRLRTLSEGSNRALIGKRVLEIEEDVLIERSELIWSKIKLEAIDQIIRTESHTVLFLGPYASIVIPHSSVTSGDLDTFIQLLREKSSPSVPSQNPSFETT